MFDICKYTCSKIPDVQSLKLAYYLHPKEIKDKDGKVAETTKEIRLIINKGFTVNFN